MSKHTPGPFHAQVEESPITKLIFRGVFTESQELRPGTFRWVIEPATSLTEGDMRLFAAAPELLGALKVALTANELLDGMTELELKQVRTAIAKAEGNEK